MRVVAQVEMDWPKVSEERCLPLLLRIHLTAPAVRPRMINRWKIRARITGGRLANTPAAAIRRYSSPNFVLNSPISTGRVLAVVHRVAVVTPARYLGQGMGRKGQDQNHREYDD